MDVFLKRQDVKKRSQWGKKLRQLERILLSMLVVVAGLAALYGLYRIVFMGSVFSIEKLEVVGEWRMLDAESVARRSGVNAGDNLFWISVESIHGRLSEEPWIKEVTVRRRLPHTLCIYVEEFRPAAIVAANDFHFVDAEGRLIKKVDPDEEKDLPVISGLTVSSDGTMKQKERERLVEMLGMLKKFDSTRFGREEGIAELNYDEVRGYSIMTDEHPMQVLIGSVDVEKRIDQIDRMMKAITADRPPVVYMIANENGRIIVRYRPV